ncbi:hypothetical protein IGI04_014490 [Brassica rapa subsp. trilocularis]|uniref:Aldehyde dehydrogenase domain-containing protein n=1 Tax=Brassica rapa subsp. trilocularis TaxID=1813537 RepID=A0ABQ7MNW1_BRACM|nr:hypothetical protein IGI04_014490 [Brassica rapa subsp. trilocularis]
MNPFPLPLLAPNFFAVAAMQWCAKAFDMRDILPTKGKPLGPGITCVHEGEDKAGLPLGVQNIVSGFGPIAGASLTSHMD